VLLITLTYALGSMLGVFELALREDEGGSVLTSVIMQHRFQIVDSLKRCQSATTQSCMRSCLLYM